MLSNVVSGLTTGTLTLQQNAIGGAVVSISGAGAGGLASSWLTYTDSAASLLTVNLRATGGQGGKTSGTGGTATTSALIVAAHALNLSAVAAGGVAAMGGSATAGVIYGSSLDGSPVNVSSSVTGGAGFNLVGSIGSGGNAYVNNSVNGSTAGTLTLIQNATGGASGAGTLGLPGTATNLLNRTVSAATVLMQASTVGGNGNSNNDNSGKLAATDGATALANLAIANNLGSARAQSNVVGGLGGFTIFNLPYSNGGGGNATNSISVTTAGEGHMSEAYGSASGGVAPGSGRNGGTAVSSSYSIAMGNSPAIASDQAIGGNAGDTNPVSGGTASSFAYASNAGSVDVTATAMATGGSGGETSPIALARAMGLSSGGANVTVSASQLSGSGGNVSSDTRGFNGAGSYMVNAVSGTTSGVLTLSQTARGGNGGDVGGGRAEVGGIIR